jgi:hypothetical protein
MNKSVQSLTWIVNLLLFASIISCSDGEQKCPKTGKVVGYDYTMCACCGGWLVSFEGETFRFYSVPDEEGLVDWINSYGFPITIRFDYQDLVGPCSDYKVKTMTCFELLDHEKCTLEGWIIEHHLEECLCCPGWVIATNSDTIKVATLPNEAYVSQLFEGSPIPIKFDYKKTEGPCGQYYKEITCIELCD